MKYAFAFTALLVLVSGAYADDMIFALSYEPALPAGESKDFIEEVGWRGFGIELRQFYNAFNPNFSFSLSWHVSSFSEDVPIAWPAALLLEENRDYTREHRLDSSPFLVHADYHFSTLDDDPPWIPYLGLGVGAYWIRVKTELGEEKTEDSNWHFGLAPEAGFMVPFSRDMLLMVAVRYNHAFESEGAEQQYLNFALGLGYAAR